MNAEFYMSDISSNIDWFLIKGHTAISNENFHVFFSPLIKQFLMIDFIMCLFSGVKLWITAF